ncbi:MAG: MFS transporter [Bacteroidales bacterium]|nr:MFS transporter [Bacteroidales bacterium]
MANIAGKLKNEARYQSYPTKMSNFAQKNLNRYLDIRSYLHGVGYTFRALESRNFRLFFFGGMVSLLGTWIQNLAIGWMVYRLTDSAFFLGLVGFAGQIPALFLAPLAGVYADRINRRRILIMTQVLPMILAAILTFLSYTNTISVSYLIVIVVINGIAMAFDTPFRHAFLLEMIGDKKLLANAVALNSTLVNTARFIGPALGGILIAAFGEPMCFLINSISFTGVIIALLAMRVAPFVPRTISKSVMSELKEGFNYTFSYKPALYMILMVTVTSIFGLPFQTLLPVFARDILHGDSQLLGFLTGAVGAGALTGAFFLASRKSYKNFPKYIAFSAITFGIGLVLFSLSTISTISILLLYFSGFGMIAQFTATNTLLQHLVEEDKRGRVLSFYSLSFMGFTPIGSLILGSASSAIGVPVTLSIAGGICLVAGIFFARKTPLINRFLTKHNRI